MAVQDIQVQRRNSADDEFHPRYEDGPKGLFCADDKLQDHTLAVIEWSIVDEKDQELAYFKCQRIREELDCSWAILPRATTLHSYGPADRTPRHFRTASADSISARKKDQSSGPKGTLLIEAFLLNRSDVGALEDLLSRMPSRVKLSHDVFAQRDEVAYIDDTLAIYELYGADELTYSRDDRSTASEIQTDETACSFANRICTSIETISSDIEFLSNCGFDVDLAESILQANHRPTDPIKFLVPGLIPTNCITLIGGKRKTGKSTAVAELAYTVATGGGTWAGFDVPAQNCSGFVVAFFGEDPSATVLDRIARMSAGAIKPLRLLLHCNETTDLRGILARYSQVKISLIVVDPTRKYYSGDEDGSDAPNELFSFLEAEANKHNCPVVVTHHPRKDARAKNLTDLASSLRGSAVFLDRPRVTIGLLRRGEEAILGIPPDADGNPLHNLPAELMFAGLRRLRRDDTSHRLTPIVEEGEISAAPDEDRRLVISAVIRLQSEGQHVTKSGKHGLFENWPRELQRLPRSRVHRACESLLKDAGLDLTAGCIRVAG